MLNNRNRNGSFPMCRNLVLVFLRILLIGLVSTGCGAELAKKQASAKKVTPTVKWKTKLQPERTNALVRMKRGADGTVYVSVGHTLYALDPNNGKIKWRFDNGNEFGVAIGKDGTVYTGEVNIYALAPDGSIKWKIAPTVRAGDLAIGSDGTVYFDTHENNDLSDNAPNAVYALDKTGVQKWCYKTKGHHMFSLIAGKDGRIYVDSFNQGKESSLAILRPDGILDSWQIPDGKPLLGSDGAAYVYALKGKSATLISDGKKVCEASVGPRGIADVSINKTVYVTSDPEGNGESVLAFDIKGKRKWAFKGKGDMPEISVASNGILYCANCYSPCGSYDDGDRETYWYAVNPDGTERWRMKEIDGRSNPPVVGPNKTVYFLSDTTVTAVSESN